MRPLVCWALGLLVASVTPAFADEPYLSDVRQLSHGDQRAGEAYFSADGKRILFQATRPEQHPYYQIYVIDADGSNRRMVSTGQGKTTCAFFHPRDPELFIYASSHLDPRTHAAPPPQARGSRYRWDYDHAFDVFLARLSDGAIVKRLTQDVGYDAECAFSPDGTTICFTARREGHPDAIWLMDADGGRQRVFVERQGVDCGGPFFSPDGRWVIYRASAEGSAEMHAFMTSLDGKETRQLTRAARVNWAPFFHPSGEVVAYAASMPGAPGNFDLFLVKTDGSGREVKLTDHPGFDGLPSFSPDGKTLLWSSTRGGETPQVFAASFTLPPDSAFVAPTTGSAAHGAHGADPHGSNPHGSNPHGSNPHGSNPHGSNPHGSNPHGDPHGSNPHGSNPHGSNPHGSNPHGDPHGTNPHGHGADPHATREAALVRPRAHAAVTAPAGEGAIDRDALLRDLAWLADDARGGRRAGSEGDLAAARYLARRFAEAGARPGARDGAWFQPFRFTRGARLAAQGNRLAIAGQPLELGVEFQPLLYSASAAVAAGGQLVRCGYAIRAPEHGHDDLAGVDLTGKVALVLTGGPHDEDGGAFGAKHPTVYDDLRYKVAACRDAGASAVILVRTERSGWLQLSAGDPGLPVLQVAREALERRLGERVADWVARLEREGPSSAPLSATVELEVRLERVEVETRNVVARVSGTERPNEVIVVGAHYDHLGLGGEGSLSPDATAVHNGADDNASGTAALIALAEALRAAPPRRTVLLVAFGAEEEGLVGSKHFVERPPVARERLVAMLNMDMIGRKEADPLLIGGVGSSPAWADLVQRAADRLGEPIATQRDGFGPSDHASFYAAGLPVFFLWTGTHADYHKPSDDVDRIDDEGLVAVTRVAHLLLRGVDALEARPAFTKVPRAEAPRRVVTGERGAYFGSIPNYTQDGEAGVLLDGARSGTPADEAGIRPGDVVVRFNGMNVRTIHDYVNALRLSRPGQTVEVIVRRGGEEVRLEATLEGR